MFRFFKFSAWTKSLEVQKAKDSSSHDSSWRLISTQNRANERVSSILENETLPCRFSQWKLRTRAEYKKILCTHCTRRSTVVKNLFSASKTPMRIWGFFFSLCTAALLLHLLPAFCPSVHVQAVNCRLFQTRSAAIAAFSRLNPPEMSFAWCRCQWPASAETRL